MAITLSAMSSMQIEIKKLLNIRKLREEKAQKHYELQVGLHQAALEKKAAQENLIMKLENAYVSAQSNFQQYQLNNVFNMEEVRSFQITQDKCALLDKFKVGTHCGKQPCCSKGSEGAEIHQLILNICIPSYIFLRWYDFREYCAHVRTKFN